MSLKSKIKASTGFLTAKGKIVNYTELHAFGVGVIHGLRFQGKKKYRDVVDWASEKHEDVEKETHYYELGYFVGQNGKWFGAGGLLLGGAMREEIVALISSLL